MHKNQLQIGIYPVTTNAWIAHDVKVVETYMIKEKKLSYL